MWKTWAPSLDWEDPLEKGMATHSSILAWRIQYSPWVTKGGTRLSDFHFHTGALEFTWWRNRKEHTCSAGDMSLIAGSEDPLEKEMTTRSTILAWETLWTGDLGGLQSVGLQRVRHDLATEQAHAHWGLCSKVTPGIND